IGEYAGRLLENLDDPSKMDWSETTTTAQRNWIGRSEGAAVSFPVDAGRTIEVYTTRPDTIYGATFMVLAPEHPLVDSLVTPAQRDAVDAYRRATVAKDLVSRKVGEKEKTGVFTGAFARNPATGRRIPVWVADYVLMGYGTGAIMAVPAHDERDREFAERFKLPIVEVIDADGRLVASDRFSGMPADEGKTAIIRWLESTGAGQGKVQYRLHDWCISRQRFWGPPIPIVYCDDCGVVPVPESDLPVLLPDTEDFRPDDTGVSPLARHEEWYYTPCPACGKRARRETDVSDTFLDSSWYYLRYPSTGFDDRPFDRERTRRWCPVSTYIGGNEHAVLHLLYSRFIAMVLQELGHVDFDEPFRVFRAHGLIVKDGAKMSKSRGNVVIPDEYIARWGADTFRTYLMFLGPFQEGGDFRDEGISGPRRFLDKVWTLVGEAQRNVIADLPRHVEIKWHETMKKAHGAIENLSFNTAIAAYMELVNTLRDAGSADRRIVEDLVVMVAPFAPHFAEECWERLGHGGSVFDERWPEWEESLTVDDSVEVAVQVGGKTRSRVVVRRDAGEEATVAAALLDDTTRRFVGDRTVRKVIYVPNRLVNLVVA
ncbi:MAG TPA: leucine--tRNA ligase, partial [Gemmatimonadales bacterium]